MVVLLAGCSSTPAPEPTVTPSAGPSGSASPEPSASPSPSIAFPVPMSITQDLIHGGAKQVVQRMMEITNNRPALKLDISATEVTLTVLDAQQKPVTLRWRTNQITPVDSDLEYLEQPTFRPTDYPLGNISDLFDTATRMGATGTDKILQIVEYRHRGVYMSVTTTPETKTVFFERDGTAVRNLGFTSVADLNDGLAAVIGGSRAVTQIGFGPGTGYWADLPPSSGVTERRIRSAALPVYSTRRNEASSLTPFDPTQINTLVLARAVQRFSTDTKIECKVEVDNRYKRDSPIIRLDCGGRTHFMDLEGGEYTEDQLR